MIEEFPVKAPQQATGSSEDVLVTGNTPVEEEEEGEGEEEAVKEPAEVWPLGKAIFVLMEAKQEALVDAMKATKPSGDRDKKGLETGFHISERCCNRGSNSFFSFSFSFKDRHL